MVGTTANTTKVLSNVTYKQEIGTLTLNEQVFHFQANAPSKTSVKCSWARVEKRQLSPASSDQHMIKLLLLSGKLAIFSVKDRATLEELRHDCQIRMDAAKNIQDPPNNRQSTTSTMGGSSNRSHSQRVTTTTTTWEDEPIRQKSTANDKGADCCGWVCVTSAFCCFLFFVLLLLMAVAAFLIYWFIFRDPETVNDVLVNTGIRDPEDKSKPPDYGQEARYGIRTPVNNDWNQDQLTLKYKLSDYILNDSISYRLYDGLKCREGSNDITGNNQYLVMTLVPPDDGGANLNNEGRGTRQFDLRVELNKGLIADAPFFKPQGLEAAVLEYCVGLSVIYNKVEYWGQEQEVCDKKNNAMFLRVLSRGKRYTMLLMMIMTLGKDN